jgi:hypothetical protein
MSYAGTRRIHDADSHIMERAEWLAEHADPGVRGAYSVNFEALFTPAES